MANPLFVCPSARYTSLLGPDRRPEGAQPRQRKRAGRARHRRRQDAARTPRDYLSYKPALAELATNAAREYSVTRERQDAAVSWLKRHWPSLRTRAAAAAAGVLVRQSFALDNAEEEAQRTDVQRNNETAALVSRYLDAHRHGGLAEIERRRRRGARHGVAESGREGSGGVREPQCTSWTTDTDGKFSLDLTKISARKGRHDHADRPEAGIRDQTGS